MSDLQLSLIVLAIICILIVWGYNKLAEMRRRKLLEARFKPQRDDAMVDAKLMAGDTGLASSAALGRETATRIEPRFDPPETAVAGRVVATGDLPMRESEMEPDDSDPGAPSAPDGAENPFIDPVIHAVITLDAEKQVSGERVAGLVHAFRRAGKQPVSFVGVKHGAEGEIHESIRAGERYETILVAVQLANRSGPLNEIEWSEFVASLQLAAEQISANFEVPDMMETMTRARSLDAQCVPLDAQIGINLANPKSFWSGEQVAALAREHGLVLRPDGRFHALGEDGLTLFVLQNGDGAAFRADSLDIRTSSRLTLLLDVPRAPRAQQPYERLVTLAQQLAGELQAIIVDDQSRPLTPAALASIGRQIEPVYARLEAEGMPAGSPRALALFG